jgi:hypothetical protein
MNIDVWIRHVVVPGITYNEEYLTRLGEFLGSLNNIKALDVLPYHTMGVVKYENLGMEYPLKGVDYMYLQGDANEVLAYLLERMNIIPGDANELYVRPENAVLSVSEEESGIDIDMRVSSESGNYAHGYTFIRDMLYRYNAKLQIIDGVL